MSAIRRRIASGALSRGERLPSIRGLATSLGLSPSTVAEAYDRLVAEGLVSARPGSGFYAAERRTPAPTAVLASRADRAIDPLWVSRQSLEAEAGELKPGCGWLPPDWMPGAILRKALRDLARADDAVLTDYGGAQGLADLRGLVARRCADDGLEVGPEQVLLTSSGTQAIDLICRHLLRPGDTVLVDDPGYFNFQALLRAHRVEVVGVPYAPTGPDIARFAEILAQRAPRLYLTNSAIHNPTGASLSPQTAHKLLTIAAAHGLVIVEDDIFAEFEPDPSPRLAALDGLSSVIRVGSFSKTLSASMRVGYVVARPDWIEGLVDLQVAISFGSVGPTSARLVYDALTDGGYRRHMDALRRRLSAARREATARLEGLGFRNWVEPRGGFYLWSRAPDGVDTAVLARKALAHGVVLAPGNVFSVSEGAGEFMRFNVAQLRDPRAFEVLATVLAEARRGD
ncbi:MAG: PLP-dependent aminotransferase family protein [Caulobacter sp.]|nr:PLP-dependent aminotransferase family protein [Caulobacter sp.]